ncbi:MAG: nucleotide-binding protein [Terrimicrobiaceae bacterium]|nr:nucleotide-binding protein [Terrimicrobiaceae bacterium]
MTNSVSNPADALLSRFNGDAGKKKLTNIILEQFIVRGEETLAAELVAVALLIEVKPGDVLIQQDACDDDIYLILSGSFDILVNQRHTASRVSGMHVGEMVAIDPTSRRSSTVIAHEHALVAKVKLNDFDPIAQRHPQIWRRLAVELSRRLKERSKFHNPPRSQPVIFIGSTVEGLPIAREILANFTHDPFVVKIWEKGIFNAGATPIEDLVRIVAECDFGIMIVTPDDKVVSRGENHNAPRDNVVFELGLLIGAIGRHRTFIVSPRKADIKIPTDLLGVTPLAYDNTKSSWQESEISIVSNEIRKAVTNIGPI